MIIILFILLIASIYLYRHFEHKRIDRSTEHHEKRKQDLQQLLDTVKKINNTDNP
jgi:hypothetical protein